MTEEVRKCVEILRYCDESGGCCGGCPSGKTNGIPNCHSQSNIADLIESLSAQLDNQEAAIDRIYRQCIELQRDLKELGFNSIAEMYAQLDQVARERDAAVEDIPRECHKCKHFKVLFNGCTPDYDCDRSDVCKDNDNWQWRGVEKEVEGC